MVEGVREQIDTKRSEDKVPLDNTTVAIVESPVNGAVIYLCRISLSPAPYTNTLHPTCI